MRCALALPAAMFLLTVPGFQAHAQSPSTANGQITRDATGGYTLRQTSSLVVLDVVVTDTAGHVVPGLTKSDFTVLQDKQPQTILSFQASGAEMLPVDATVSSTRQLDTVAPMAPVTILLLDEFNTRFEDIAFARYSLKKYLDQQPDRLNTPTMLIAVSMDHFTVLQDYTTDKQAVLQSLEHALAVLPWQVQESAWVPERFATASATLMRVAEASEGHPGHKNMIWIGRGFPEIDFHNQPAGALEHVNEVIQQCVDELRDARITLYSIDPAGVLTNPESYEPNGVLDDPFGGNYQFSALARATGGRALYGQNDVDAEIADTVRDGEHFYTLSYRPTDDSTNPKEFHRIRVLLAEPGLTAATREGYYQQRAPEQVNQEKPSSMLKFDLLAASDSSMVYDAVPLQTAPIHGEPNSFKIVVDPQSLVWSAAAPGQPRKANVVLMVSAFDRKGNEVYRDAMLLDPSAPANAPATEPLDRGITMVYTVPPTKQAVRARFVVRVTATGRMGSADVPLTPAGQPGR